MYGTDVLIVGAGPTGLTLAIELARRSIAFRLIEAANTPFAGSRGKGIQPRTLEVFHDLGIIEKILNAGMPYPEARVHLGPLSLRLGPLGGRHQATEDIPYPNLWLVSQNRTEAILRERLAELGGQVEFGAAFESLEQLELDAQWVQARLSTGESVRAKYLVGCDGGHSAVRKAAGLVLSGETLSDKLIFIADMEIPDLDHRVWHIWPLARGGPLALCPLSEESLFQMTSPHARMENPEQAVYKVCKCKVRRINWSSSYRPASRMVNRYRAGRVFLAGDAAHLHPPTGGQGLNTGIQDAYNLGWKLASVFRGGPESLLDTYEEERLPVAAAVLGLSSRIYKKPLKRREATNQLALHYRASSLSSGAPLGRLQPGDRMPNLQLANGNNLFDEMRGTHATEVVTKTGARILVRPDGYIASIGTQPTAEYAGERTRMVEWAAGEKR